MENEQPRIVQRYLRAVVTQDDYPSSPREWTDDGSVIVTPRMEWCDESYKLPGDYRDHLDDYYVFGLSYEEHGYGQFTLGTIEPHWDGGPVGYFLVKRSELTNESDAARWAKTDVKVFNQYLLGDVWQYAVELVTVVAIRNYSSTSDAMESIVEYVDGCCGFYGEEYAVSEANYAVECEAKRMKVAYYRVGESKEIAV
jgi:hypothetical protein